MYYIGIVVLGSIAMVSTVESVADDAPRDKSGSQRASQQHEPMLFPVCEHGRWGYINNRGELAIPLTFTRAEPFSDGLARVEVETKEGKRRYAFVDGSGRVVIGPDPPDGYGLSGPLAPEWGYHDFHGGLAGFWVGDASGKGGYIDKKGKVRITPRFQHISDFSEGVACVSLPRDDGSPFGPALTGFIDSTGRFVIEPRTSFVAHGFVNGRCVMSIEDENGEWKYGVLDRSGETIVRPQYDYIYDFSCGLACVRVAQGEDVKYGYIDLDGCVRMPLAFDEATSFANGRAYVARGGKATIIDTSGGVLATIGMNPETTYVADFSEGFAGITVTGTDARHCGFIDECGRIAIPTKFNNVDAFSGGLARARREVLPDISIVTASSCGRLGIGECGSCPAFVRMCTKRSIFNLRNVRRQTS